MVFTFFVYLLKDKNKYIVFGFIENANSKDCTKAASNSLLDFLMAGFQNNRQDHRRLSEQLLYSQAAMGKPERIPLKVV